MKGRFGVVLAMGFCAPVQAAPDDLAKAFGARETVLSASLAPDGSKIALITAAPGRQTRLMIIEATEGATPKSILLTTGKPENLSSCEWVANDRLACQVHSTQRLGDEVFTASNLIAIDAAGGNTKLLSQRRGENALGWDLRGGSIVDLLPNDDGAILMARSYVPEAKIGSLVESKLDGLGVDRVDTRTGAIKRIERPAPLTNRYISDGRGTVRVMGTWESTEVGYRGKLKFLYRVPGTSGWANLSSYDAVSEAGFWPVAVDPVENVAYGTERVEGRDAIVSMKLAPGLERKVVFSHPQADVNDLVTVGRSRRVVGVSYALDHRYAVYFDPKVDSLVKSLGRALGNKRATIADMSEDEQRLLVWAGSDVDPGQYYLFNRATKQLSPVMPDRPELVGRTLAVMKPVNFKVSDGTIIPAYLTLPPGKDSMKGLPAVVMPHGGPESRDEWGFEWMSQYFAARGFAVIQPQFRGSYGFGKQWQLDSGYRSWKTSVGDVVDAGRWLVAEGADPTKLTILGWSYGGYAALQAQAIDPSLFKAIVAIAPVTNLAEHLAAARKWGNEVVQEARTGRGAAAEEASPTSHVAAFKAPVLMFHGTDDANVDIKQARMMQSRLENAGKRSELVVYEGLAHSLVDSDVRADMLQRAGDFLLAAGK
jgi:dipeptidyl aminopeptidase/acylaminoacyl peptidase